MVTLEPVGTSGCKADRDLLPNGICAVYGAPMQASLTVTRRPAAETVMVSPSPTDSTVVGPARTGIHPLHRASDSPSPAIENPCLTLAYFRRCYRRGFRRGFRPYPGRAWCCLPCRRQRLERRSGMKNSFEPRQLRNLRRGSPRHPKASLNA